MTEENKPDILVEFLNVAHFTKYNLYMLSKAILFNTLHKKGANVLKTCKEVEKAMGELDLDTKARTKIMEEHAKLEEKKRKEEEKEAERLLREAKKLQRASEKLAKEKSKARSKPARIEKKKGKPKKSK